MPKYRIVRSGRFQDVFEVEAGSPEEAITKWESGTEVEGACIVNVEGVGATEVLTIVPPQNAVKPKKPRRKRRTKAEIAEDKANKAGGVAPTLRD